MKGIHVTLNNTNLPPIDYNGKRIPFEESKTFDAVFKKNDGLNFVYDNRTKIIKFEGEISNEYNCCACCYYLKNRKDSNIAIAIVHNKEVGLLAHYQAPYDFPSEFCGKNACISKTLKRLTKKYYGIEVGNNFNKIFRPKSKFITKTYDDQHGSTIVFAGYIDNYDIDKDRYVRFANFSQTPYRISNSAILKLENNAYDFISKKL